MPERKALETMTAAFTLWSNPELLAPSQAEHLPMQSPPRAGCKPQSCSHCLWPACTSPSTGNQRGLLGTERRASHPDSKHGEQVWLHLLKNREQLVFRHIVKPASLTHLPNIPVPQFPHLPDTSKGTTFKISYKV